MTFLQIVKLIPFKVWAALILGLVAAIWGYGKVQNSAGYNRALTELAAQSPIVTRETTYVERIVPSPPVVKFLPGETVKDTSGLALMAARLTREQLETLVKPYGISRPITATDEPNHVAVSFDLSLTANPMRRGIENLTVSNVRSTYPSETVTLEKYLPRKQNLLDLFARANLGGLWNRPFAHDLATSFEIGGKLNVGRAHLSFAPGVASMQSKGYTYYVLGLEYTFTESE